MSNFSGRVFDVNLVFHPPTPYPPRILARLRHMHAGAEELSHPSSNSIICLVGCTNLLRVIFIVKTRLWRLSSSKVNLLHKKTTDRRRDRASPNETFVTPMCVFAWRNV